MDVGELCVGVRQIQLDLAAGLGSAAGGLSDAELEPMRQIDASAVLGTRHGIADRLAEDSTTPGTTKYALRASMSISSLIGLYSGSSLSGDMAAKTHHIVAASLVSCPVMIFDQRIPLARRRRAHR